MNANITFEIIDIIKCDVDVIVNAANTGLWHGGGVDGHIRDAAGRQMDIDLEKIGHVDVGEIVVTGGYNLPQKYVFHTAGPDCSDYGGKERPDLLSLCYKNALDKALELNAHSIAFPCISTGIFGYDKKRAAVVALKTVDEWLNSHPDADIKVIMTCYSQSDKDAFDEAIPALS